MSLDILELDALNITDGNEPDLVAYVVDNTDEWERVRDMEGDRRDRWDEYYRMWRGIPPPHMKKSQVSTQDVSRAVMPAMQSAVETIVAEQEEATFGRKQWLIFEDADLSNDPDPEARKQQLAGVNRRFLEDSAEAGVPQNVAESYLNGALYGNGIGKVVVTETIDLVPTDLEGGVAPQAVVRVGLQAVSPYEFVISPGAQTIDDAHGMAHVTLRPIHQVYDKIDAGIYRDVMLEPWRGQKDVGEGAPSKRDSLGAMEKDVHIIEYHGLVPAHLLPGTERRGSERDRDLVEAIVTVVNKTHVLRAVRNPFLGNDRSFIAYQQDTIPGEFWGRGPTEKGYWSQKVLDAEVDARISALAFSAHPMMITDITRMAGRGQKLAVRPGKNVYVNGDPSSVMYPIKFPPPDPQTYRQASEMERMLEMATGSLQAATSSVNERGSTATGATIIQSVGVKRNKRTMQNIERNFLRPFVRKALLRYMQFSPEKYPFFDYQFKVNATMGIVARELESQQLSQLLSTVPGNSPAYWLVLRSIYANSSLENKDELEGLAKQMFEQSLNPPQPEPDLGGIARIEGIKQRAREHDENLKFKYDELAAKEDDNSRDRQVDIAKEFGK